MITKLIIAFIAGLLVGAIIGVFLIALVSVNRDDRD